MGVTHEAAGTARPAKGLRAANARRQLIPKIPVELLPGAKAPVRAHPTDAGLDLFCHGETHWNIKPGEKMRIHTGVMMAIPPGYAGFVYVRSGFGTENNTTLTNSVGVIDSDYRGEIMVTLTNHSDRFVTIEEGDKVAQIVIAPVFLGEVEVVDELDDTQRGSGGFGSTGS
jgi:dUTP pyrophosphatase